MAEVVTSRWDYAGRRRSIAQNQAESVIVHDAFICVGSSGCASGTRTTLEYYTMTIDRDGFRAWPIRVQAIPFDATFASSMIF
jgi:hypothetical protein